MEGIGTPEERKQRSIEILKARDIPFIDHLPVAFDDDEVALQPDDAVKQRLIATTIVAVYGANRDRDLLATLTNGFGAVGFFTPDELEFFTHPDPPAQAFADATWRYESASLLLWALGLSDELAPETQITDVSALAATMTGLGTAGIFSTGRLRPTAQLLDYADLIYRVHWACVEARLQQRPPPVGLEPGVVYERHYSMNWLVGLYPDWDTVSTDT